MYRSMGCSCRVLLLLFVARICWATLKEVHIREGEPDIYDQYLTFGIDRLRVGRSLGLDSFMVPLQDKRPRLNPHILMGPTPGCDMANNRPCFLQLSKKGVLAVYSGTGPADPDAVLQRWIGGVQEPEDPFGIKLVLNEDGSMMLRSSFGSVLWTAGSSFPSGCYADSACTREAYVSLLSDGSLAMFLGLSVAAETYLEVGLPALKRVESCLWHNDFTGPEADAPRATKEEYSKQCHVPPSLGLISFPASGTSFTLMAVLKTTNFSTFTLSEMDCNRGKGTPAEKICGQDAWGDLGLCPQTHYQGVPPPGKGALVKNHVVGRGYDALCSEHLYERGLLMSDNGKPFNPYGFARLFRNPFDNIVGRMHHRTDEDKMAINYDRDGFLSQGALFPQHDIWIWLYWHLNANLALMRLNKPTALLMLADIDKDQGAYIRYMTKLLGYSEEEVTDEALKKYFPPPMTPEEDAVRNRFRYGEEDLPSHIDLYDAPTVHYLATAMNTVMEGSACMTRQFCLEPPEGFRDATELYLP